MEFVQPAIDVLSTPVDPGTADIDVRQLLTSVIQNQQASLANQSKVPANTRAAIQKTIEQITNSIVINSTGEEWLSSPVTLVASNGSGTASVSAYVPKTAVAVILEASITSQNSTAQVRQNGSTGYFTLAATGTGDKAQTSQGQCPIDPASLSFQYALSGAGYIKLCGWINVLGASSGGGGTIIGSATLAGLSDVSLSDLADANILVYNSGAAKWENVAVSGDATVNDTGVLTLASVIAAGGPTGSVSAIPVITYDAKGRLTVVTTAATSGIAISGDVTGTLGTSTVAKINGATLGTVTATAGQIMVGDGSAWQSVAMSGDATLASTGALTLASVLTAGGPQGDASHTQVLTWDAKGRLTAVTNTAIGSLNASAITAGTLALARGGTNADLSATGGTSNVLQQSSLGAAVTVGQLAFTDISGTLAVNAGGTGQTSYTNGQLLIGNTTGNTLTKATLTQGAGISITNGGGSITIAATGLASSTLTSAHLYVGNGSNVATDVAASGDVTLANTGAFTVTQLQSNAVKSGTPTNNQVLTWINANSRWEATTWSTGLPAAGSANNTLRDTGSVWSSVSNWANDGNSVTLTMGSTSTDGVTVAGIGSQTADYLKVKDSGANNVFRISSAPQILFYGPTSGAIQQLVNPSTPGGAGTLLAKINFDAYTTGTTLGAGASIAATSEGAWASNTGPSRLGFFTAGASGAPVEAMRIDTKANVILGGSLTSLATNATDGSAYLPSTGSNGAPAGTATTIAGNTAFQDGGNLNVLFRYSPNLSNWQPVCQGTSTAQTLGSGATYTILAYETNTIVTTSGGAASNCTVKLPLANTVPSGRTIIVSYVAQTNSAAQITIGTSGSDNITGPNVQSTTLGTQWICVSNGSNRWIVSKTN